MRGLPLTLIVFAAVPTLIGCGEAASPARSAVAQPAPAPAVEVDAGTPESTVERLLELAEAGDWGTYVDDFYGEQHKFRPGRDDRDLLVRRLSERGEQITGVLRRLTGMQPQLTEDGTRAVYDLGDERNFTLYRADDGRWTFHL